MNESMSEEGVFRRKSATYLRHGKGVAISPAAPPTVAHSGGLGLGIEQTPKTAAKNGRAF